MGLQDFKNYILSRKNEGRVTEITAFDDIYEEGSKDVDIYTEKLKSMVPEEKQEELHDIICRLDNGYTLMQCAAENYSYFLGIIDGMEFQKMIDNFPGRKEKSDI